MREDDRDRGKLDEAARLMMHVARGDTRAFARLYRHSFPWVRAYLAGMNGHNALLNDLVQEVFARIWAHRAEYSPNGSFRNYVLAYARRIMLEHRCAQRRGQLLQQRYARSSQQVQGEIPVADEQIGTVEVQEQVRAAIARLTADQKEAVRLYYIEGMSLADGAQRVGCTVKAFSNRVYRAREQLRLLLRTVRP